MAWPWLSARRALALEMESSPGLTLRRMRPALPGSRCPGNATSEPKAVAGFV